MKPLEYRPWFAITSMLMSAALMFGLWYWSDLQLSKSSGLAFTFATVGLYEGLHRVLALGLIKVVPSLGSVV